MDRCGPEHTAEKSGLGDFEHAVAFHVIGCRRPVFGFGNKGVNVNEISSLLFVCSDKPAVTCFHVGRGDV